MDLRQRRLEMVRKQLIAALSDPRYSSMSRWRDVVQQGQRLISTVDVLSDWTKAQARSAVHEAATLLRTVLEATPVLDIHVTTSMPVQDSLGDFARTLAQMVSLLTQRHNMSYFQWIFAPSVELQLVPVLLEVRNAYENCMNCITRHNVHLQRLGHREFTSELDDENETDGRHLTWADINETRPLNLNLSGDYALFWRNTSEGRFVNETEEEVDHDQPPDPDRRRRTILKKFRRSNDREMAEYRFLVNFLQAARHPNLPQLIGYCNTRYCETLMNEHDAFLATTLGSVTPFSAYLKACCVEQSKKDAMVFLLSVLTDLRQLLEYLDDHEIVQNRDILAGMVLPQNLYVDELNKVIAGPVVLDFRAENGQVSYMTRDSNWSEQTAPWEIVVDMAKKLCPTHGQEPDEWADPVRTVLRALEYNVRELLFTDWHLASGNYEWRDELLEQLKPPDPIEVEGTARIEEADGEAYWESVLQETTITAEDDLDSPLSPTRKASVPVSLRSSVSGQEPLPSPNVDLDSQARTTTIDLAFGSGAQQLRRGRFPIFRSSEQKKLELQGILAPVKLMGMGGFADVWLGEWTPPGAKAPQVVAIKYLRAVREFHTEEVRVNRAQIKCLYREVATWQYIRHRFVLPLFGHISAPQPCIVSPWCSHGSIVDYLRKKKRANRLLLLTQIVEGLVYLHERKPPLIHGDLKPDNILVNDLEEPVLADFGLARVRSEVRTDVVTSGPKGNFAWMAPELHEEGGQISAASDVYTIPLIACLFYSGIAPFSSLAKRGGAVPPGRILMALARGKRPLPNEHPLLGYLVDKTTEYAGMWELFEVWWAQDPECRPTAREVLNQMKRKLNKIERI